MLYRVTDFIFCVKTVLNRFSVGPRSSVSPHVLATPYLLHDQRFAQFGVQCLQNVFETQHKHKKIHQENPQGPYKSKVSWTSTLRSKLLDYGTRFFVCVCMNVVANFVTKAKDNYFNS